VFNLLKMVLPGALPEMILWTMFKIGLALYVTLGMAGFLAVVPALSLGSLLAVFALPVTFKWVLMGRYKPGQRFLWSGWMWRNELVYEMDAVANLTYGALLDGTPWLPMHYRMMGAKIGRQVCMHRTGMIEADLVKVGDHVVLEGLLQTHLFEDRVMKLGTIEVGEGASVGGQSTVLYDTKVGAWASIGDASLVMKHEMLLAGHRYRGLPVENVTDPAAQPAGSAALRRSTGSHSRMQRVG
jgi:non-ribosomal peptide synthetase-like protein